MSFWKVLSVPLAPEKATDMLTQLYTHAEFAWLWGYNVLRLWFSYSLWIMKVVTKQHKTFSKRRGMKTILIAVSLFPSAFLILFMQERRCHSNSVTGIYPVQLQTLGNDPHLKGLLMEHLTVAACRNKDRMDVDPLLEISSNSDQCWYHHRHNDPSEIQTLRRQQERSPDKPVCRLPWATWAVISCGLVKRKTFFSSSTLPSGCDGDVQQLRDAISRCV